MDALEIDTHRVCRTLEELDLSWESGGAQVRRHLGVHVLETRAGWALIVAAFRDVGKRGVWGPADYRMIRLRRSGGRWEVFAYLPLRGRQVALLGPVLAAFCARMDALCT